MSIPGAVISANLPRAT